MRNQLWQNQQEAYQFALRNDAVMLDMDMGTGKTRVAIDVIASRVVKNVLVLCPKAVIPVWPREFTKHGPYNNEVNTWTAQGNKSVAIKVKSMLSFYASRDANTVNIYVMNYDIAWRPLMRDAIMKMKPEMVILDESHRAKSAGSKISRFLAMLGKQTKYKMCLSGTPMANSPLDLYGQYRFLDPKIFGTRYDLFRDQFAILGGPERNFVVGYRNQDSLMKKFKSIAYSCKMEDIKDRLKLPDKLPHQIIEIDIPNKDMKLSKQLAKEFIAEVEDQGGHIVLKNVLHKMLRLQQITSGFTMAQEDPLSEPHLIELNTAKEDALSDLMLDMSPRDSLVVFVVFRYDILACIRAANKAKRRVYELSGSNNQLEEWNENGGVIVVQIQAGSEGIDFTKSHTCVYYSLPTSIAMYEQSMARLYRPGQTKPVNFIHLIAAGTIDEDMMESVNKRRSMFDDFMNGKRDYGFIR